jgi:DNA-binding transcriptional MerR regulator
VQELDIAEVARLSGVAASTLRYYEERELIRSTGRRFDGEVLQRLTLISLGRAAGFSLDEIARMFAPDGRLRIDRALLVDKADELDQTILRLQALSKGLRHAASCKAPSHMECPSFRRLVKAAQGGRLEQPAPRKPRR